jgi:hypothetical protein
MKKAFPSCPGLDEVLFDPTESCLDGQHSWYSICSAHRIKNNGCNLCEAGRWILISNDDHKVLRQIYDKENWHNGTYYGKY